MEESKGKCIKHLGVNSKLPTDKCNKYDSSDYLWSYMQVAFDRVPPCLIWILLNCFVKVNTGLS